jgi:hypothetical protein
MISAAHARAVLTHVPTEVGLSPVRASPGLRRAFTLSTDIALNTWEEVTGHRGTLAWVHWQVRAVLYRHGVVGAAGDHYAVTVAEFVVGQAHRAVEAGQEPRRAVLTRIPREAFKASALWPGLHPMVSQAGDWEQFLGAAEVFYTHANATAAAAAAVSDTATTFGPMEGAELRAETTRIARWLWQAFAPVPGDDHLEGLADPWTRGGLQIGAAPELLPKE